MEYTNQMESELELKRNIGWEFVISRGTLHFTPQLQKFIIITIIITWSIHRQNPIFDNIKIYPG